MPIIDKIKNFTPTQKIAISLIAKDAVGCYLYVSQARKNKQFTPQQRSDVANYDLANGVINIALQLLAVRPIENLMTKMVENKMLKNLFHNLDERLADSDSSKVIKLIKENKKTTSGLVALFSVIICQYFIKRVVSPYFSVPAGEKSKQLGLIKPKLYEGETYDPKGHVEKIKDAVVNTYENIEDKVVNTYETIQDKVVSTYENIEDKFEDKFELQKDDD